MVVLDYLNDRGMKPSMVFTDESHDAGPSANEVIVAQLIDMGFPRVRCEKAARSTLNNGVEEAMNWLLSHTDDAGTFLITVSGMINSERQDFSFYLSQDTCEAYIFCKVCL